jgi:hypothetical protein
MSVKTEKREEALTGECVRVLEQCAALLERLDAGLYADAGGAPAQSGAGGHVRHCLDFFNSFLEGLAAGRVDYDRRERDPLVERDPATASARLRFAAEELRAHEGADPDRPLLVKLEGADAEDETAWRRSSVGRELQFLSSHAVHHYALVALLLRLRGFEPGEEFGVAPSTLRHWRGRAANAR